jgi:hypothetical protein
VAQNRESGAAGNAFGHENAPKIAEAIGAIMLGGASNEANWNGIAVVIKTAGKNTTSVVDLGKRIKVVRGI